VKRDKQPAARKFAGYTILRLLGSGGMGSFVWPGIHGCRGTMLRAGRVVSMPRCTS
jgi:hypothetical protein